MDTIEFKDRLINLIKDISLNMNNIFLPIVSEYNLTIMQAQMLRELKTNSSHNISSLAKSMNIQNANASLMCKQLEQKGFLERRRCNLDERIVNISLTSKGIYTINEIDNIIQLKYCYVESNDYFDDLQTIIDGLEKLRDLLANFN